jgi:hypothetical protein
MMTNHLNSVLKCQSHLIEELDRFPESYFSMPTRLSLNFLQLDAK